jgi:autotransporter-associated beta strand protein
MLGMAGCAVALIAWLPQAGAIDWDGGGADNNWSTTGNWNPDGNPAGLDVLFNDDGGSATQGTVTSIVDQDFNIASLKYENTNGDGHDNGSDGTPNPVYHTTQINTGHTLTVNGDFVVGPDAFIGSVVKIKGQAPGTGTLVVNHTSGNLLIDPGPLTWFTPGHTVTLDMRELGTFEATTGIMRVGVAGAVNASLYLAESNTITADSLGTGKWNSRGKIYLGQSNTLNIDQILPAADNPHVHQFNGTTGNLIKFDSGWTDPSVTIRDKSGSGRADMIVTLGGDTNGAHQATVDLTGGTVDALFDEVVVGRAGRAREGIGTFSFDAGTVDATNILLGHSISGNANAVGTTQGTLNIGGTANLLADTITVADEDDTAAGRDAEGRLNLTGGSLRAAVIQRGDDDGDSTGVSELNWSAGTIGNKLGGDMNISGVDVILQTAAAHPFDAEDDQTITVESVISGGSGGVVKQGLGTLVLNADNTYTGGTDVEQGMLVVDGSLAGGPVAVADGAMLGGNGTIGGAVTVDDGGAVSGGASIGLLSVDSDLDVQGTLLAELGGTDPGTGYDQIHVTGEATIGGTVDVDFFGGFVSEIGQSFDLLIADAGITNADISGITFDFAGADGGHHWEPAIVGLGGSAEVLRLSAVPEPSACLLLACGGLLLLMRRRR